VLSMLRLVRVLKDRNFSFLWTGHTLSHLGDNIFRVALVWLIVTETNSAQATALVFMAFFIPNILVSLFAGATVDRFSRKGVILASDGVRALMTVLLAVLVITDQVELWSVLCIYVFFGIADAFFQPAYTVIINELVDRDIRASANSMNGISRQIGVILGPALGAMLVETVGTAKTFLIDALCLAGSLLSIAMIRYRPLAEKGEGGTSSRSYLLEIREGLKYTFSVSWLWITIIVAALSNAATNGVFNVALPFLVKETLGSGAGILGLVFTLYGVGAVLGGLFMGSINFQKIRRLGVTIYLLASSMGVAILTMGAFPALTVLIMMAVLFGFCLECFGVVWITLLQERVPSHLLGRVSSVDTLGSFSVIPIGLALAGMAVSAIGPDWTFIVGGAIVALMPLLGLLSRSIRNLGVEGPEGDATTVQRVKVSG
jgi:MFS family permease